MNSKHKKSLEIFIFLFVFSFIIINWDSVSWLFNYREIDGLAYDFFNPYQDSDLLVNAASSIVSVNPSTSTNSNFNNLVIASYSSSNSLAIPSINVNTPVVAGQSTDNAILEENLDKGAVYYPGSVLPGQNGQIVILGHSAPPNWPKIKHDYIFSDIEKLNIGDQMILTFNNVQYTYKVIGKKIIKPGQDIDSSQLSGSNNILTLISCWPPGNNYQRITVSAELVR